MNPTNSFVETVLLDCFKEILCDVNVESLLSERLDHQPLSLYDWTKDSVYISHKEVRNRLIENYANIASTTDLNSSSSGYKKGMVSQQRNNSQQSSQSKKKDANDDQEVKEAFNEAEETKLEDKYMNEIIQKFKYNNQEINEKLLFINEESKGLMYMIMENTAYNIVSEAVYGETDLSVPTKIFFLKNKPNN